MNTDKLRKLAEILARDIFATGEFRDIKITRLQFMSGKWPDNEKTQGGVCEKALVNIIYKSLKRQEQTP